MLIIVLNIVITDEVPFHVTKSKEAVHFTSNLIHFIKLGYSSIVDATGILGYVKRKYIMCSLVHSAYFSDSFG